jgi:rod shape-determining protein MreC
MISRPQNTNRKRFFKFLVFVALVLLTSLLFLSKRGTHTFFVDHVLMNIAFPFQKVVTVTADKADRIFDQYLNLVDTKKENEALKKMVNELKAQTVRLEELERENRRLRELLDFKQDIASPMLPAEIIATSPTPWMDTVVVDKGTKDGVQQGMPVVSEKGVVGYVLKTTRFVSTVMFATHYNCRIDAIVQRTRSHGVVGGLLEGHCRLFNVLRTEDISEGDLVVTSGFGNRFPRGLLIGVISKVKRKRFGLFQEAEIDPSVDFSKLEEVFILLKPQTPIAALGKSHHE